MKRTSYIYVFLVLAFLAGCKEQSLDLYETKSSIYFPDNEKRDFMLFSFGYISAYVTDTVVRIPVITTGPTTSFDRTYKVEVSKNSTLREGIDYKFNNESFTIKAGNYTDTILLHLFRTSLLKSDTLNLELELVQNENFNTEMYSRVIGTGESKYTKYFTKLPISVDDIVGIPWFWDPKKNTQYITAFLGNLGNFSPLKFQLLIGRYNLDVEEITKEGYLPTSILSPMARDMQAYLNEMEAKGTPILEADGTKMKMGQYVQ